MRVLWITHVGVSLVVMLTAVKLALVTPLTDKIEVSPTTACEEFSAGADGLMWSMEDCTHVWSQWAATVPPPLHRTYLDRQLLSEISVGLRQRGTPCLVESTGKPDGAGSTLIRNMATWVLARDIGCDWVMPEWGPLKMHTPINIEETTVYCHSKKNVQERNEPMTYEQRIASNSCEKVSWLYYFHYDIPSVQYPADSIIKAVTADSLRPVELSAAVDEVVKMGLDNVPWDTLVLNVGLSMASRYMVTVGNWDSFKRSVVRDVLKEMRTNFYASPRPWWVSLHLEPDVLGLSARSTAKYLVFVANGVRPV